MSLLRPSGESFLPFPGDSEQLLPCVFTWLLLLFLSSLLRLLVRFRIIRDVIQDDFISKILNLITFLKTLSPNKVKFTNPTFLRAMIQTTERVYKNKM